MRRVGAFARARPMTRWQGVTGEGSDPDLTPLRPHSDPRLPSAMLPHRPAAVVCDMDGLLVDSERLERRAWQAAATDHGIDMSDDRFATFVGHPADEGERMLLGYFGVAFDVAAYRESCHRRLHAIMKDEGVPLRPGAVAWLD